MPSLQFWAGGQPVPYNRESARYGRTAPRNSVWRQCIQCAFLDATDRVDDAGGYVPPLDGPIRMAIEFHGARSGCDGDNLSKEVMDALSRLAYQDDSQIRACTWEIADWRPRGTRAPKGPRKSGALITIVAEDTP